MSFCSEEVNIVVNQTEKSNLSPAGALMKKDESRQVSRAAVPVDDDESTRSSEDGVAESLKDAQRESEKAARKEEAELRKKAQAEAAKIDREDKLRKLRSVLTASSSFGKMMFQKLTEEEPQVEQKQRGRKRKTQTPLRPATGTRKRTRKSVIEEQRKVEESQDSATTTNTIETEDGKENQDSSQDFKVPELFTGGTLRDYQVDGLKWLSNLHINGINGILADEMGLGKTIQVIAQICVLYEQNIEGPFLILAPLSTIANWQSEFAKFAPKIPVIVYHGTKQDRLELQKEMYRRSVFGAEKSFPVFLTTYEIILRDVNFFMWPTKSASKEGSWSFFVIDEGHRLKNYRACLTRTLKELRLDHRLILTGTPLQNDLSELWSLLNFILPTVFNNRDWFQDFFDFSWVSDDRRAEMEEMELVSAIHEILNPFLLRRVKKDVELGLPPKREVIVYAPLTKWQRDMYTAAVSGEIRDYFKLEGQLQKKAVATKSGKRARKDVKYDGYFKDDSTIEERFLDAIELEQQSWKEEAKKPNMANENKLWIHPDSGQKHLLNVKVMNCSQVLLREITMHPYLLCQPVVDTEQGLVEKEATLKELVENSGKMMVLDRLLEGLKKGGHKVLLFSLFTGMLDLIQDYCCLKKYGFRRLDGSCQLDARREGIAEFNNDSEIFIYLISTKAGGLGINLTGADTVIFFDSDWNPQTDIQAQDRCHRIGQTKPVRIYRLTGKGTIDEKIMERATNKRRLEKMVIFEKRFKGKEHDPKDIDNLELLKLLKSTDYSETLEAAKGGSVISDEDLENLLDRSEETMRGENKPKSGAAFQAMETGET